jgi:CRISPR-associated protein Cmr4
MYFPWGVTSQANGSADSSRTDFEGLLSRQSILQIGGQESLGRGFVQQWLVKSEN